MPLAARFNEFGPASVLKVENVPLPTPGPGEVRVRVKAASLNPVDSKLRFGRFAPKKPASLPAGIGQDLAGIVDQVGDGVTSLRRGDEVFGTVDGDAVAEYVISNPANFALKPAGLSWPVAAALPIVGQTALDSFTSQSVTSADRVLVSAAAGGVGVVVAQLARAAGARVYGTASEPNHEFLRQLGITPISYGADLAARVRQAVPEGITVVFDNFGVETVEAAIELGVDKSRINSITHVAGYGIQLVGRGPTSPEKLAELARAVVAGTLTVPIHASFDLADVAKAYALLDERHTRGKIVINV